MTLAVHIRDEWMPCTADQLASQSVRMITGGVVLLFLAPPDSDMPFAASEYQAFHRKMVFETWGVPTMDTMPEEACGRYAAIWLRCSAADWFMFVCGREAGHTGPCAAYTRDDEPCPYPPAARLMGWSKATCPTGLAKLRAAWLGQGEWVEPSREKEGA